ncbi:unnamed protein product, partial [Allacma fusca]
MRYLHIAVAFILLAAYSTKGVSSKPQKKILCRFAGKEYSPGDVWYPPYERYCIRCSCLMTSKLNCTSQECPLDCNIGNKMTEHPCCKSCSDSDSSLLRTPLAISAADSEAIPSRSGGGLSSFLPSSGHPSAEEDEEEEPLVTENSEYVSCLHQGKIYRDGESFTANVSGLPISAVDQCMQCVCQSGMVLCQMKYCSSFKCSSGSSSASLTTDSDTCCQRCSAWKASKTDKSDDQEDDDLAQKFAIATGDHRDSKDSSVSMPVATDNFNGVFGGNPDSSITFRDISPLNSNGNGRDFKKQQVDDCISGGRFYMHGSTWHPVIGPFGVMECVVCKCARGQIDCGRLKCPPKKDLSCSKPAKVEGHCCPICTSASSSDGSKMCVSGKQDLTAFRSHGFGLNGTEFIHFGFLKTRRNADPQVDQHEWTLRDGEIIQFTTKYMSNDEFLNLRSRHTFVLLGATNEKNVEKFTRREKKLEKRCTSRCSVRISGLERSLRIHRLTS